MRWQNTATEHPIHSRRAENRFFSFYLSTLFSFRSSSATDETDLAPSSSCSLWWAPSCAPSCLSRAAPPPLPPRSAVSSIIYILCACFVFFVGDFPLLHSQQLSAAQSTMKHSVDDGSGTRSFAARERRKTMETSVYNKSSYRRRHVIPFNK